MPQNKLLGNNRRAKSRYICKVYLGLALFVFVGSILASSVLAIEKASQSKVSKLTTIRGKLTSASTNLPILNGLIEVFVVSGKTAGSAVTDSAGNYVIREEFVGSNLYFILAKAAGFKDKTLSGRPLRPKREYIFNFSLKPLKVNTPPKIESFLLKQRATFIVGDRMDIAVTATDRDGDRLEYRYLLDGQVLKDWSGASSCNYQTKIDNRGRHKLRVEVRDKSGSSVSEERNIYIFRQFSKPN